ncbi:MAG: PorT family protein, partial [Cyclobacteriaceae bacterium]
MRIKYTLLTVLLLLALSATAQIQMGFKLSPYWSSNRVNVESSTDVTNNGNGLRITFGPVIDVAIDGNENYFFSTGLWLSTRRAGISYS